MTRKEQVTQTYFTQSPIVVDIYCRVSTDDQEENTSLVDQEKECRKFAEEHGMIIGIAHSEAASGFTLDREKLILMQERYKKGIIRGVVIYKISRLARRRAYLDYLLVEMELAQCEIYCVTEKIERNEDGQVKTFLSGLFAERERKDILDRTKRGKEAAVKDKGQVGVGGTKPIFGYDWIISLIKSKHKKMGYKINEKESELIIWGYEQYDTGVSLHYLKDQLKVLTGQKWSTLRVKGMLTDIRYTGTGAQAFFYKERSAKYHLETIDLPDGTYPKIIDMDLYQRVQERIARNSREVYRHGLNPEHFLLRSGFMRCGICGRPMTCTYRTRKTSYRCIEEYKDHVLSISSLPVDEAVWAFMVKLSEKTELIGEAIEYASSANNVAGKSEIMEEAIARHLRAIEKYQDDLKKNNVPDIVRPLVYQDIAREQEAIDELRRCQFELQELIVNAEKMKEAYAEIYAWCKKIKEAREELTYHQKRDFMRLVGVKIIVGRPIKDGRRWKLEFDFPQVQSLFPDIEIGGWQETGLRASCQ
jgi:site-specific DNA recombinase